MRVTRERRVQSNPRSGGEPRAIHPDSGDFFGICRFGLLAGSRMGENDVGTDRPSRQKETEMQRDALASVLPHSGLPIGNAGCHDSILPTIGLTPLVKLRRVAVGLQAQVLVKV